MASFCCVTGVIYNDMVRSGWQTHPMYWLEITTNTARARRCTTWRPRARYIHPQHHSPACEHRSLLRATVIVRIAYDTNPQLYAVPKGLVPSNGQVALYDLITAFPGSGD